MAEQKTKAYAVTENYENNGGIIYAKNSVTARRIGVNEYADGEFSDVTCRRAPWADIYHGKELPAGIMINEGWHFECSGCGITIDHDYLWETDRHHEDVIGHQNSLIYCDAVCEASYNLERAKCQKSEKRWMRRFSKIVKSRFPDSNPIHTHAYARLNKNGFAIIQEIEVEFDFPDRKFRLASLSWRKRDMYKNPFPKPQYRCSYGDVDAFERYAKATRNA